MLCSGCGSIRPVDTMTWSLTSCTCKMSNKEVKDQLEKYKRIYLLLTVKGEMEFDKICEWSLGQMDNLYSPK